MIVSDFISWATRQLSAANIGSARLDSLILLEDATGKNRAWLLAHPEYILSEPVQKILDTQIRRRQSHTPLAYIRGWTEFYGRKFLVNQRVLEPRPESETMLDLLKQLDLPKEPLIIDVGTGSGALAISAKLELPDADVTGTDIDEACLRVAHANAEKLGAAVNFIKTDLLAGLTATGIILANLPYVPDNFAINQAAMNEPKLAIFGGPDGLDLYRRMFEQIGAMQLTPTYVLCESLPPQHDGLWDIAAAAGYRLTAEQDFIQVFTR